MTEHRRETKKERIHLLLALILIGFLALALFVVVRGQDSRTSPVDVSKLDTNRSNVMVTGSGYKLMDKKEQEEEKKEESSKRKKQKQVQAKKTSDGTPSSDAAGTPVNTDLPGGAKAGDSKQESADPDAGKEVPGSGSREDPSPGGKDESGSEDGDSGEKVDPKAPKIELSIQNGQTISGNFLSFTMSAKDYKNRSIHIFYFDVRLNGEKMVSSGGGDYKASYSRTVGAAGSPTLRNGLNTIVATVKDRDGRTSSRKVRISMNTTQSREENGTCFISFDMSRLGVERSPIPSLEVKIYKGEKVSHAVERYFRLAGVRIGTDNNSDYGYYLERVYKTGITSGIPLEIRQDMKYDLIPPDYEPRYADSLGAQDFGKDSGWCYSLNGEMPSGMSSVSVEDGDEIVIWYTL